MSGKTFRLKKLLHEQLMEQLDYLFVFSPTLKLSSDWEEFKPTDQYDSDVKKQIVHFEKPDEFEDHIKEIFRQQRMTIDGFGKKKAPSILLIVDDCINERVLRPRGYIDRMSVSMRHYNISCCILAQRIAAIPRTTRINSKYVILFSSSNFSEMERFLLEFTPKNAHKDFRRDVEEIFDNEFNFILCMCFEPKLRQRLWLNGDDLLTF